MVLYEFWESDVLPADSFVTKLYFCPPAEFITNNNVVENISPILLNAFRQIMLPCTT
jgi:hypothetical protein